MPNFGNYNPASFGWHVPAAQDIVPFTYDNVSFPGGANRAVVPLFREALRLLVPHIPGGLHSGWCWGYVHRAIRNGTRLSFHSYGLALDINAPANPYSKTGKALAHTMPNNTAALLRPLMMEWGGAWTAPRDYMHIEFHGTPAEALHLVSQLTAQPMRQAGPAPAPSATYAHGAKPGGRVLREGMAGDDVAFVQRYIGTKWTGPADGKFGAQTTSGVRQYQQLRGLAADGIVGPATWHQLGVG